MNGFLPLTRGASPEKPPNMSRLMHGDPGGSADMTRLGSPVKTPNDGIFRDGDRGYVDQRGFAIEPGKPVVPVNPFVDDAGLLGKPPTPVLKFDTTVADGQREAIRPWAIQASTVIAGSTPRRPGARRGGPHARRRRPARRARPIAA